ncbi:MAG: peptidoglycan DD-metalloendopeptidase family protein [Oscillospiraceae bacterium]|nr:peptidoglycan DD-metalloendopeptidase family protein [Oscillospiraceae bacterium]
MEDKKSFGSRVEAFFAGKGFYIVLLLCVTVIGVSAWAMLTGGMDGSGGTESVAVAAMADAPFPAGEAQSAILEQEPEPETWAAAVETEAPAETKPPEASPVATAAAETVVEDPVPAEADAKDYYIWPVSGAVETGYSMAALVYNRTMQDWRTHDGLDIAAAIGTQVRAAANGRVTDVYADDAYGTTVVISHNGGLCSVYSNLAATPTVAVGDTVGVGQVIGAVGDTALAEIGEPAHLHFAMTCDGESVDPGEYMP